MMVCCNVREGVSIPVRGSAKRTGLKTDVNNLMSNLLKRGLLQIALGKNIIESV
jgi:hypothetical protein